MKKAYLSLFLSCIVPLMGVYFFTGVVMKKSSDNSLLLGPSLFASQIQTNGSVAKF